MNRSRSAHAGVLVIGLCGLVITASGLVGRANQTEITEDELGPMMAEIRLIVSDSEQHVDSRYWPELGEDLDKLFPMFRQIEAFWTARGNDGAVGMTQDTLAALKVIGDAGIAMEQGQARAAISALRGTGHTAHRDETADGYRIKPGSLGERRPGEPAPTTVVGRSCRSTERWKGPAAREG